MRRGLVVFLSALVGCLALAGYVSVYLHFDPGLAIIRSDGEGYYAYLAAADRRSLCILGTDSPGQPPIATGLYPGHSPCYLDKYGIGEAVLMAPFYAAGKLAAKAAHRPSGTFSSVVEWFAGAAAAVYLALGLWFLGLTLLRYFARGPTALTVVGLTFGSNLFHYATFDSGFSHVFTFAAVSLALYMAHRCLETGWAPRFAIGLGLAAAVMALIRPPSLVMLVAIPLLAWRRGEPLSTGRARRGLALAAVALVVPFTLQVGAWHVATGGWLVNPYPPDAGHFEFRAPHLVAALTSFEPHGLFPWSPVLVLATLGLPLLWWTARPAALAIWVSLASEVYVVGSWSFWSYAGGFGNRGFIDAFPLWAFGLAALLQFTWRSRVARAAVLAAVTASCLLTVAEMLAYWQGRFGITGANPALYWQVLREPRMPP